MILPIISVGLGVVGAATQIAQQNAVASRQNQAIAAQQAASAEAEAIRLEDAKVQEQILLENYLNDARERRQRYRDTEMQLRTTAIQNKMQNAQIVSQTRQGLAQGQRDLSGAENQVRARTDQRRQQGDAAVYAELQSEQQGVSTDSMRQAQQTQDSLTARRGSAGRVSKSERANYSVREGQRDAVRQIAASSMRSRQIERNIAAARLNADIMNEVADIEQTSTMRALNQTRGNLVGSANTTQRLADSAFRTNARLVGSALKNLPRDYKIQDKQAQLDYLTASHSIRSRANLVSSAGNSERVALAAQRVPGVGFLDALSTIGGAAMPGVAMLMQQRASSVPSSSSSDPYYQPGGVLQDVPNPVPVYA